MKQISESLRYTHMQKLGISWMYNSTHTNIYNEINHRGLGSRALKKTRPKRNEVSKK